MARIRLPPGRHSPPDSRRQARDSGHRARRDDVRVRARRYRAGHAIALRILQSAATGPHSLAPGALACWSTPVCACGRRQRTHTGHRYGRPVDGSAQVCLLSFASGMNRGIRRGRGHKADHGGNTAGASVVKRSRRKPDTARRPRRSVAGWTPTRSPRIRGAGDPER